MWPVSAGESHVDDDLWWYVAWDRLASAHFHQFKGYFPSALQKLPTTESTLDLELVFKDLTVYRTTTAIIIIKAIIAITNTEGVISSRNSCEVILKQRFNIIAVAAV